MDAVFCDRLGVVVIVLLSLQDRFHVDRWDDPRFVAQAAQRAADEMGAQTRLHADDARRKPLEHADQRKSFDLPPQHDLAVCVEADDVEDVLPDIDADGGWHGRHLGRVGRHELLLLKHKGKVLSEYPSAGWGSSRSIPLAAAPVRRLMIFQVF